MSAEDFIKRLFDTLHLPKLFESEEKLLPLNSNVDFYLFRFNDLSGI